MRGAFACTGTYLGLHIIPRPSTTPKQATKVVKAGDEAEVAIDAVPGRVFRGKVRTVLDAIAAGQIQASGALVDFAERTDGGRALAIIDLEDDISKYQIPVGAAGQVAIYTEHWHYVSLLRKILLRMRSWENYLFLEGH